MSVFSEIPFPEEIGQDTLRLTKLRGILVDIHAAPISATIKIALNKRVARYKIKTNVSGDEQEILSDENTGDWFINLADNFNMTPDAYYRITINEKVFRKNLPDFPAEIYFNQLEDY